MVYLSYFLKLSLPRSNCHCLYTLFKLLYKLLDVKQTSTVGKSTQRSLYKFTPEGLSTASGRTSGNGRLTLLLSYPAERTFGKVRLTLPQLLLGKLQSKLHLYLSFVRFVL